LPAAVQDCSGSEHWTGGVQVPLVHVSAELQHGMVPLHDWLVSAQVGPVLPAQVPLVAPAGMSQVRPEQQSAFTVQAPVSGWQAGRQMLPSQIVEQHSPPAVQAFPFGRQEVHFPPRQSPTQHCPLVEQVPSGSTQEGGGCVSAQTQPTSPA
jgi:hypothetical protein